MILVLPGTTFFSIFVLRVGWRFSDGLICSEIAVRCDLARRGRLRCRSKALNISKPVRCDSAPCGAVRCV